MKTFTHGIVMIVTGIFAVLCIYTIFININTKRQLENTISIAVDSAVEQVINGCNYRLMDEAELKYEFLQNMCLLQPGDGDIRVDFNHVDYDEGLLAVTVSRDFTYPIGTKGEVVCKKLVIFDEDKHDDHLVTLSFYDEEGQLYRAYKGHAGDAVSSFFDSENLPCDSWIDVKNGTLFSDDLVVWNDMDFKQSAGEEGRKEA